MGESEGLPYPISEAASWVSQQSLPLSPRSPSLLSPRPSVSPPLLMLCAVLNGLDNLEARRHVNRLCMAAQRPLIESGTAGYLGQCTVHLKGRTECFECTPKVAPKSFPICTLRNTCVGGLCSLGAWVSGRLRTSIHCTPLPPPLRPDRPIHCIVWAKDLLYARLFGKPDAVTG